MFQQEKIFDAVGIHQNAISRNLLHAADVMTRRCCSPPPQSKGVKIIYKKKMSRRCTKKIFCLLILWACTFLPLVKLSTEWFVNEI